MPPSGPSNAAVAPPSLSLGHLRLIQDYLGHRDPKHTIRYTRTAAGRSVEPGFLNNL
jgi:hypothetical protein